LGETSLEPDELVIDVITKHTPTSNDVGKLLVWFIDNFDDLDMNPKEEYSLIRRVELESVYLGLLKRVVELAYPGITLRFEPWNLTRFGVFDDSMLPESRGALWPASSMMNDRFIRHILRNRQEEIPSELRENYAELIGLRCLRQKLRTHWIHRTPRQKTLLVTASVIFCKDSKDLIEYDGGLLTISSRNGNITWYGLESKSGKTDPKYSLDKRLQTLNIKAKTTRLDNCHAFAKISL